MKIDPRFVRKVHRRLGLAFSVTLLMSSASGVMHSVMSRTQAPPPAARPSQDIDVASVAVSPADAAKGLGDLHGAVQSVSIRPIEGEPWYQFIIQGETLPRYVHTVTGSSGGGMDERYAAEIASTALGGVNVRKTGYLTDFNMEYINIFRVLPVYRFDAQDGLGTRVYVSTMTGSVTRSTNDRKQWEADFFSNFHKLMFIRNKDLRDLILTAATAGIFVVGVLGILLFFMTQPRKSDPKKWR
ncbi:MAG: hypothetical protein KBD07_06410 [Candidatus Omnitrophica bacterium]|jgi:hypothetical protein|nr:hypothetical protein [Candidatus Omnitrophota bacterium]